MSAAVRGAGNPGAAVAEVRINAGLPDELNVLIESNGVVNCQKNHRVDAGD